MGSALHLPMRTEGGAGRGPMGGGHLLDEPPELLPPLGREPLPCTVRAVVVLCAHRGPSTRASEQQRGECE
jgi:hypothetical protein